MDRTLYDNHIKLYLTKIKPLTVFHSDFNCAFLYFISEFYKTSINYSHSEYVAFYHSNYRSVLDFSSKNLELTSKLLTQGYKYHKLRKTFEKFFRSYSDLFSTFGEISFQEYVTEGISQPVFYGDLVYKLRRVRCEANLVSSVSKIVKRLRRRKYDPLIIERTIGLELGPSTALYRSFLKHCTLTNKAVETI